MQAFEKEKNVTLFYHPDPCNYTNLVFLRNITWDTTGPTCSVTKMDQRTGPPQMRRLLTVTPDPTATYVQLLVEFSEPGKPPPLTSL